jgi:hypothetical protein
VASSGYYEVSRGERENDDGKEKKPRREKRGVMASRRSSRGGCLIARTSRRWRSGTSRASTQLLTVQMKKIGIFCKKPPRHCRFLWNF